MRIVGGEYKGKRLASLKGNKIRPTSDRTKEAIFNIISEKIANSVVIDAFSGSGALGIEALSRGAKEVVFIDKDAQSVELIKKNLSGIEGNVRVMHSSAKQALVKLAQAGLKADLIFVDPPYKLDLYESTIRSIVEGKLLAPSGMLILEKASTDTNDYSYKGLRQYRQKKYGDSMVCFYKFVEKVAITGTFDPFTLGHMRLVEEALAISPKVNIVLLKNDKKQEWLSSAFRLELIKKAVARFGDSVAVDKFDGLTIDYCRENDVQLIIRGVRNKQDAEYEQLMADWNFQHGKVSTMFVQAEDVHISSSIVRQNLANGLPIRGFVPEEIIGDLEKAAGIS